VLGLRKDHKLEGETEAHLVRGLAEIQTRLNRLRGYEVVPETGNLEPKALLNCTLIEQRLLRAIRLTLKLLKDTRPVSWSFLIRV